jgi:hypothetical protein
VSFNGSILQEMVVDLLAFPHLGLKHMKTSKCIMFKKFHVFLKVDTFIRTLCFKLVVVSFNNIVLAICTDSSLISQQHMLELE